MVVVSGGGWGVGRHRGSRARVHQGARGEHASSAWRGATSSSRASCERRSPTSHACACTGSPTGCPSCWPRPTCSCTPPAASPASRRRRPARPVVSYGLPVGHARLNTRAMAALELLRLASDTDELREQVRASFARGATQGRLARGLAELHADRGRTWCCTRRGACTRSRAGACGCPRLRVQLALLIGVGAWMMSTDEVTALATQDPARAPARAGADEPARRGRDRARARRRCVARGRRAGRPRHPRVLHRRRGRALAIERSRGCTALGDEVLPEVPGSGPLRWERTRGALRSQARALGLSHRFYYLQPRGGLSVGQLVLARTAGATPVKGALRLSMPCRLPHRPMRAGDVAGRRSRRLDLLGARARADRLLARAQSGWMPSRWRCSPRSPSISASSS